MAKIVYKITFFDYWHTGSGLSGSTYADNLVNKNEEGLPVIPGKTIKGLLREAAESIHRLDSSMISTDFIETIFGKRTEQDDLGMAAVSFFSNATLSKKLSEHIIRQKNEHTLYHVLASTAIDENGQAQEGSLRQLEVTIPLNLYGFIENMPQNALYEDQLRHCFNWVKQIGVNRNRGLGRCQFSIIK